MRATTTSDHDSIDPAENFLQVLDQFAALRAYSQSQPTIGGYRVLTSAKRRPPATWTAWARQTQAGLAAKLRDMAPEAAERAATSYAVVREFAVVHGSSLAAAAVAGGGRLRTSGFLSVLLIAGMAVAVLSGPSGCACSTPVEQANRDRLNYSQNVALIASRDDHETAIPPASADDLAFLASDRPLKEREPTVTASMAKGVDATATAIAADDSRHNTAPTASAPDATGAIDKVAAAQTTRATTTAANATATAAEPLVVAALGDSGSTGDVSTQTAAPEGDGNRTAIDTRRQNHHDANADDDDDEGQREKRQVRSSRKRNAIRAYRTPVHQVRRRHKKKAMNAHLAQRAPAWAQQMYATTWHSQAFSYNR